MGFGLPAGHRMPLQFAELLVRGVDLTVELLFQRQTRGRLVRARRLPRC